MKIMFGTYPLYVKMRYVERCILLGIPLPFSWFKFSFSPTPPLPVSYNSSYSLVFLFYFKFSVSLSIPRPFFFLNLIFSSPSLSHVLSWICDSSRLFWTHDNRSKFSLKLEFLIKTSTKLSIFGQNFSFLNFLLQPLLPALFFPAPSLRASLVPRVAGVLTGEDGVLTEEDGVLTGEDGVLTGPDGVLTEVDGMLTREDGVMARLDWVEIRGVHNISTEEQSKLLVDVAAYKARISFLESKLAELGFIEDASNDDSVAWIEELFEDGAVEQLEN
jgi:hypothetical protein